jgi:CRISPR/Cas system-associated exonuclease Cas4 (RecB family)
MSLELSVIPEPVEKAYLNPWLSPSQLTKTGECLLRSFGRDGINRDFLPSLISGPYVEIGNLIHRAIELADGRSNIHDVFVALKKMRESQLESDLRRKHYCNLSDAIGETKWAEKISILMTHHGELQSLNIESINQIVNESVDYQGIDLSKLAWPSTNYEVFIRSEALGLSGRVDRMELRLPNTVVITDVKTGEVKDSNGKVLNDYVMQMAAYELLVNEVWPNANIELVLDASNQYQVDLSTAERAACKRRVAQLRESLGKRAKTVVAATEVQKAGKHCLDCPIRHVCSTYRKVLETDGFNSIIDPESNDKITDGYGTVVKSQFLMGSHVVNIKTSSGRLVQIRSRYDWQVKKIHLGQRLFFFNFTPKKNGNRMSVTAGVPSNYSDEFFSGRNWSSEVFLSND